MTDPFAALRAPASATEPDADFAIALRARIERALALPKGVHPMTSDTTAGTTASAAEEPRPAAVPYLAVRDARAAIDWYADVFGARLREEPIVMPDGRIGHAELAVSGGVLYLADEHPEIGVAAPRAGAASVSLMLAVPDADAVRSRAIAAGATGDREPYDGYGQRNAWIVDPFGHRWGLSSPLPAPSLRQLGDIGYVALWVPDAARAARFYADVLGWDIALDGDGNGGRVRGAAFPIGITAGIERPTLFCCYAVDDIDAALRRVGEAGGSPGEPHQRPEGLTADCLDDEGTRFALYRPASPGAGPRTAGDLAYLTVEVVDSARARAFYAAVLGWRYAPGSVPDGWQVQDTVPMIGIGGGHDRTTAIPMWRVADIAAAVRRVRAAGGTAGDPTREPYGLAANCVDDQGMRFDLGQL